MLRLLFFVMLYLTDYRAAADALQRGLTLGLVNAAAVSLVAAWLGIRGWRMKRAAR